MYLPLKVQVSKAFYNCAVHNTPVNNPSCKKYASLVSILLQDLQDLALNVVHILQSCKKNTHKTCILIARQEILNVNFTIQISKF